MIRVLILLCWIASLVVLATLISTAFGIAPAGWLGRITGAYGAARDALPIGLPAIWRDLALFYILFGVVEKAFTESAYDYAGLVAKYQSRKTTAKAGRAIAGVSGTLLWPVSIALDTLAVLLWNSEAGEAAKTASQQTLRSLRLGLTHDEVEDVVSRYGRLTYMARPLFVCALCLSYLLIMSAALLLS